MKEEDCLGKCENYHGWFVYENDIEKINDIIEYKGKKYDVRVREENYRSPFIGEYGVRLTLTEHKEEILDEVEKEYLRNVIKYIIEPTHNEIRHIHKNYNKYRREYFIYISFLNNDNIFLPYFKDERMYKGMETNKEYTLEELGLK